MYLINHKIHSYLKMVSKYLLILKFKDFNIDINIFVTYQSINQPIHKISNLKTMWLSMGIYTIYDFHGDFVEDLVF